MMVIMIRCLAVSSTSLIVEGKTKPGQYRREEQGNQQNDQSYVERNWKNIKAKQRIERKKRP